MELIVTFVFASIGLLFTVLGIIFFFIIDELLMPVIFTILGIIFAVIGIAMLINNRKNKKKQEEIFANGTKYTGIIVEHVSGSGVTLNGMLPIALVVKCTINGIEREFVYNTEEYDAAKYPINSYCDIYVYGVQAAVDKKSIRL